jgi:hypothetical protein
MLQTGGGNVSWLKNEWVKARQKTAGVAAKRACRLKDLSAFCPSALRRPPPALSCFGAGKEYF